LDGEGQDCGDAEFATLIRGPLRIGEETPAGDLESVVSLDQQKATDETHQNEGDDRRTSGDRAEDSVNARATHDWVNDLVENWYVSKVGGGGLTYD